ncbi:uncharacterized protein VTP21DRAFT_637 [Calcarisporiella thermophila]|uniref:uncharacterized protein n=1 Tax=Calcarisporiella thermophila TaxID=911321 RepID=UPI003742C919
MTIISSPSPKAAPYSALSSVSEPPLLDVTGRPSLEEERPMLETFDPSASSASASAPNGKPSPASDEEVCPTCATILPAGTLPADLTTDDESIFSPSTRSDALVYPNVGNLLWEAGYTLSDVRLTFDDGGRMAERSGIPPQLWLHSLILCQSEFFRKQLTSRTRPLPARPRHIVVKVPPGVTKEDMLHFYVALKLIYTKAWAAELKDDLRMGCGVLSVCYEIGFAEGMEEVWRWVMLKCHRERNREMMQRLIEAYPSLYKKFAAPPSLYNAPARTGATVGLTRRTSSTRRRARVQRHRRSLQRARGSVELNAEEIEGIMEETEEGPRSPGVARGVERLPSTAPHPFERYRRA